MSKNKHYIMYINMCTEIEKTHQKLLNVSTELLEKNLDIVKSKLIIEEEFQKFHDDLKNNICKELQKYNFTYPCDIKEYDKIQDEKIKQKVIDLIKAADYTTNDLKLDHSIITKLLLEKDLKILECEIELRKQLKLNKNYFDAIKDICFEKYFKNK